MILIDNFDRLKYILNFEKNTFYTFVALVRAKDFKDSKPILNVKEKGEILIRQWFVDSEEILNKYKEDMKTICSLLGARLYMTLDKKSVRKTVLELKRQVDDLVAQYVNNPNYEPSLRAMSKMTLPCAQKKESSVSDKRWMIDVDTKNEVVCNFFERVFKDYLLDIFNTINGYHIILERKMDANNLLQEIKNFNFKKHKANIEKSFEQGFIDKTVFDLMIKDALNKLELNKIYQKYKEEIDKSDIKTNAVTLVYAGGDL